MKFLSWTTLLSISLPATKPAPWDSSFVWSAKGMSSMNLMDDMPFALQTKLESHGAGFVAGSEMESNVVQDRNFITGQSPASTADTAQALVTNLPYRSYN